MLYIYIIVSQNSNMASSPGRALRSQEVGSSRHKKRPHKRPNLCWISRFVQLWISGFGQRQILWLSDSIHPLLSKYFHPLFCRTITRSRAPKTNKKGRPEPEAAHERKREGEKNQGANFQTENLNPRATVKCCFQATPSSPTDNSLVHARGPSKNP